MADLKEARSIVKSGDNEIAELLYDSVPEVLSELVRTAQIPSSEKTFVVAD